MNRADSQDKSTREVTEPAVNSTATSDGRAPGGMWWVAWRQHRFQLAISFGLLALAALALIVFRWTLLGRLQDIAGADFSRCTLPGTNEDGSPAGCPNEAFNLAYNDFAPLWALLRMAMLALPIVLGAFVGAPLFAREFEQHTQVYVLTQSVSRMRWWATKVTVAAAPVVLAMIGLGMLVEWAIAPFDRLNYSSMGTPAFETRGIIPAAFLLLAIAFGVTAGIAVRSTVIGLGATIIAAGILIAMLGVVRPHLLDHERVLTPVEIGGASTNFYPDRGTWFLDSGYLDATGAVLEYDGNCPALAASPNGLTADEYDGLWVACLQQQGITDQYVDYLPAERRTALQLAVAGISTVLAAAILAAGALILRRRVL